MVNDAKFAPWNDPAAKPLIEFRNVTKRFGEFTAVDDLTQNVYPQEFFALLGPSGCGKTTMMRMLAGFEAPTTGTILIDGRDMSDVPPNKRAVNMMFQSYALFPHLSVWENIAFGLKRDGKSKDEIAARVTEMLRLTRLEAFAKRKPHQISGGQRQRVALARSLAKAPKLLLLDEPLGALDKKLREETQFELMDIQEKTGTTFVIVTHDQEEAMTVASRVAVMDQGKIVQVDTPERIYEAPNSVYVADFIGDVNLIRGTAKAREAAPPTAMPPAAETASAPPADAAPDAAPDQPPAQAAETASGATPEKSPAKAPETAPVKGPDAEPNIFGLPRPKKKVPKPERQAPRPNATGIRLYNRLFAPILGKRDFPAPESTTPIAALPPPHSGDVAPAPFASEATPAPVAPKPVLEIPPGGLLLHWAEGQPEVIAANGPEELAGKPVTLALRPEKVAISKDRPEAVNALPGKVIDIGYLGNLSTYHVQLTDGTMIKAQATNTRRIARRDITWDDSVWVSFSATAGVVLAQ